MSQVSVFSDDHLNNKCKSACWKNLGVLGVWELSLLSVIENLSYFWSTLNPPCSSDIVGCLVELSSPDKNSMLCFKLSSLSYWEQMLIYPKSWWHRRLVWRPFVALCLCCVTDKTQKKNASLCQEKDSPFIYFIKYTMQSCWDTWKPRVEKQTGGWKQYPDSPEKFSNPSIQWP